MDFCHFNELLGESGDKCMHLIYCLESEVCPHNIFEKIKQYNE